MTRKMMPLARKQNSFEYRVSLRGNVGFFVRDDVRELLGNTIDFRPTHIRTETV